MLLSSEYPEGCFTRFLGSLLLLTVIDRCVWTLGLNNSFLPPLSQDEASRSPSLPGVTGPHYVVPESSSSVGGKAAPPTKEKPKRNGARGIEDVRPSVESLLDELESSVPSPV